MEVTSPGWALTASVLRSWVGTGGWLPGALFPTMPGGLSLQGTNWWLSILKSERKLDPHPLSVHLGCYTEPHTLGGS